MDFESPSLQSQNQDIPGQTCIKCGAWKPIDQFYNQSHEQIKKNRVKKKYKYCKDCYNESARSRKIVYKETFGVTKDTPAAKALRDTQVGTPCHCCGTFMEKPQMDHCHKTVKFRGWLCYNCNVGLGKFGDDIPGLMQAVKYIERFNETLN